MCNHKSTFIDTLSLYIMLELFFLTFELRGFPFAYSKLQVKFAWITSEFRFRFFIQNLSVFDGHWLILCLFEKVNIV